MHRDERRTLTVHIGNLTEAQALAVEDMLAQWVRLGSVGASRWVAFFADGDGNFQPGVLVDGRPARECPLGKPEKRWQSNRERTGEVYWLDFDSIAWALHDVRGERMTGVSDGVATMARQRLPESSQADPAVVTPRDAPAGTPDHARENASHP